MSDDSSFVSDQDTVVCPHCAQGVVIDHSQGSVFECPHCGMSFDIDADEKVKAADDERRREEELDGMRIRQLSTERRAVYRQRSYFIVGTGACVVGAMQLVWMTIQIVLAQGWSAKPVGYILFAIVGTYFAISLFRKAVHVTDVLKHGPEAPSAEPDFSTLSDGQDRWQNLHDVR